MNLENLTELSLQLDQIGFKDTTACLAKHICLLPAHFTVSKAVVINSDELLFHFVFKANPATDLYFLDYFDAGYQKHFPLDKLLINDIPIDQLDQAMKAIDWKMFFDFSDDPPVDQETILSLCAKIEQIIRTFAQLARTEEGKQLVTFLKQKHWSQLPASKMPGAFSMPKDTADITQRFYCKDQPASVTVHDVYRFLQYKKLEKDMRAKGKKQATSNLLPSTANEGTPIKKTVTIGKGKPVTEPGKTH